MWVTRKYAQNIICKIPFSSSLLSKILPPFSNWEEKNITYHHWALDLECRSPSLASTDSNCWRMEALPRCCWSRVEIQPPHLLPLTLPQSGKQKAASHCLTATTEGWKYRLSIQCSPLTPSLPTSPQREVKNLLRTDRQGTDIQVFSWPLLIPP